MYEPCKTKCIRRKQQKKSMLKVKKYLPFTGKMSSDFFLFFYLFSISLFSRLSIYNFYNYKEKGGRERTYIHYTPSIWEVSRLMTEEIQQLPQLDDRTTYTSESSGKLAPGKLLVFRNHSRPGCLSSGEWLRKLYI